MYIDWFRNLLDYSGYDINLAFYADHLHLNRLGVSILNKKFSEFVRNRRPYKYQVKKGSISVYFFT